MRLPLVLLGGTCSVTQPSSLGTCFLLIMIPSPLQSQVWDHSCFMVPVVITTWLAGFLFCAVVVFLHTICFFFFLQYVHLAKSLGAGVQNYSSKIMFLTSLQSNSQYAYMTQCPLILISVMLSEPYSWLSVYL